MLKFVFLYLLFFSVFGAGQFVFAKVELVVWQASPASPKIILPKRDNESLTQAVQNYLSALLKEPRLKNIIPEKYDQFQMGEISLLNQFDKSTKPLTAINANWFQDMTAEGPRILRNIDMFSRAGTNAYVIALAAEVTLNQTELVEFEHLLVDSFNLMVSLGGDDVSPELYKESKTWSHSTNSLRDSLELNRVKKFKAAGKGVFFGICRGHQLGAIADGHSLYQDLSQDGLANTSDHINLDGKNSTEMQTWHHIQIEDSLLKRFLGKNSLVVNSIHHQAVRTNLNAESFPVARDGLVAEALQSKNRLSLSVQFHPEFSEKISNNAEFSEDGFKIIGGIVAYSRLIQGRIKKMNSCQKLFI
ncbi:MAG: gamma-glutamyl-gamma-aminobutyrate hydrolase family protein [Pseudobdellovibrio sp.]